MPGTGRKDLDAEACVSNNLPVFEETLNPRLKRRSYSNFAPSEQCPIGKQQLFPAQFAHPCPNEFFIAGTYFLELAGGLQGRGQKIPVAEAGFSNYLQDLLRSSVLP